MQFEVLKPFTWAGSELQQGNILEIPDESSKIGSLVRARFIRYAGEALPGKVSQKEPELPKVEEVAQEVESEQQPQANVNSDEVETEPAAAQDPREIVRQAKAKAAAKK